MSLLLAFSLTALSAPAPVDELTPGFEATPAPYPANATVRNLADGSLVTSDGFLVQRWLPTGAFVASIGSFSAPGTTGAMEIDPDETFVVVGQSDTGELIKVDLGGLGQTALGNVPGNRDLAFEDDDTVIINSIDCGNCDTTLFRLDTNNGSKSALAAVDGDPGPLAFGEGKSLFYASVDPGAAPGSTSVLRFAKSLIQSPPTPVFQPNDNLVVIEIESSPPNGDWTESTAFPGFTGTSYYRWDGPDLFGSPGSGIMSYDFEIEKAGNYRFRYHNRHEDLQPDQDNDAWVRVDGGQWLKIFSNQGSSTVGVWNWHSIVDLPSGQYQANWDLTKGQHTVEISGRSNGFKIDRMVFFQDGSSEAIATDLSKPESIEASFTDNDAQTTLSGLDGATDMVHEEGQNVFFLAENNASNGKNRLVQFSTDGLVTELVKGDNGNTLGNLDYTYQKSGTGVFYPFQPEGNGALAYTRKNGGLNEKLTLAPLRPELNFTGPGTISGSGQVTVTIKDAYPNGLAFFFFAPIGSVNPVETAYFLNGLPLLHTPLDLAATTVISNPVSVDGSGNVNFNYLSLLGSPNVIAAQATVTDLGLTVFGTTTTKTL
ncbi:MAG: hypothetical protein AAF682_04665 [Planctomycetota bacterium]